MSEQLFALIKHQNKSQFADLQSLVEIGGRHPSLARRCAFGGFGADQPFKRVSGVQNLNILALLQRDGLFTDPNRVVVSSHHVDIKHLQKYSKL